MSLIPIKNAPVRFIESDESSLDDRQNSGCHRHKRKFAQISNCSDEIEFQVDLGIIGSNQVSNGDFSSSANWTFNSPWTYDGVNDEADHPAGGGVPQELSQSGVFVSGKYYRIRFTSKNFVNHALQVQCGSGTKRVLVLGAIMETESQIDSFLVPDATSLGFRATPAADYSIDDVDVRRLSRVGWGIIDENDEIVYADNNENYVEYLEAGGFSSDNGKGRVSFSWGDVLGDAYNCTDGCYRLFVFDLEQSTTTNIIIGNTLGNYEGDLTDLFRSEPFDVKDNHDCTLKMSWNNDEDAFGFSYIDEDINFDENYIPITHVLRLDARLDRNKVDSDDDMEVTDSSDNVNVYSQQDISYSLRIEEVPEYIHDAVNVALDHDNFSIEDEQKGTASTLYIHMDGDYDPDWNDPELLLSKSLVELKEKRPFDAFENKEC